MTQHKCVLCVRQGSNETAREKRWSTYSVGPPTHDSTAQHSAPSPRERDQPNRKWSPVDGGHVRTTQTKRGAPGRDGFHFATVAVRVVAARACMCRCLRYHGEGDGHGYAHADIVRISRELMRPGREPASERVESPTASIRLGLLLPDSRSRDRIPQRPVPSDTPIYVLHLCFATSSCFTCVHGLPRHVFRVRLLCEFRQLGK